MFRSCALALLPCLCLPAADMPSAAGLIARALELDKQLNALQAQYTYTEEVRNSQVSNDGKVGPASVKTFDVVSLEGEPYRKLISLNGKPLSHSQQRKVDEDFQRTQAERRAARHSPFHVERKAYIGGLPELMEYFDNRVTGAETVRGRPTWVMESWPKSGVAPTGKQQAEILSWRHKSWFDQEDGTRVQWQDTVIAAGEWFSAWFRNAFRDGQSTPGTLASFQNHLASGGKFQPLHARPGVDAANVHEL